MKPVPYVLPKRPPCRAGASPKDIDALLCLLRATLTGLNALNHPAGAQPRRARQDGRP